MVRAFRSNRAATGPGAIAGDLRAAPAHLEARALVGWRLEPPGLEVRASAAWMGDTRSAITRDAARRTDYLGGAMTDSPTRSFASLYGDFFRRPRATVEALAGDERRVRFGFYAMLVPLFGYVVVYLGLSHSGAYPSKLSPWLNLPAETYYRYNVFLLPPGILAGWLLSAAVVQLLGRIFGARGSFEDSLTAIGFSISAGSWALLPHDVTVAVLGGLHVIDGRAHEHAMNAPTLARHILWFFMAVYGVAFPVYFTKALGAAHRVGRGAAVTLGVAGFFVYQLVFLLFNR
jgi:hypothetical protein